MSILLSGELEVDGDLKVTGTIQNDSLAQVILFQQQQISALEALISQLQAQIALIGGDLGYADCFGLVGGNAVIDECGVCDGNNESMDICGTCSGDDDCSAVDPSGYIYPVTIFGDQVWITKNISFDGSCYDSLPENCDVYGGLYNYESAQNICGSLSPGQWKLPTDVEWMELEEFLGMADTVSDDSWWRGVDEGAKIAGNNDLWVSGFLTGNSAFGSSGFNALPAGSWNNLNNHYVHIKSEALFWTSNAFSGELGWIRRLNKDEENIYRYHWDREEKLSVRCIKD